MTDATAIEWHETPERRRADDFARHYFETTGRRIVLGPQQWRFFAASGLDMTWFELGDLLPPPPLRP